MTLPGALRRRARAGVVPPLTGGFGPGLAAGPRALSMAAQQIPLRNNLGVGQNAAGGRLSTSNWCFFAFFLS